MKYPIASKYINKMRDYTGYIREINAYFKLLINTKRDPLTKFVITTTGRTGSNLLVELLNSHPKICCESELLVKKVFFPMRYLYASEKLSSHAVYGFKLNTYNFGVQRIEEPVKFVRTLYDHGYKFISLKRRDIIRQAISRILAIRRGKYHFRKQDPLDMQMLSVNISPDCLKEELDFFRHQRELEESMLDGIYHLTLYYEDHLSNADEHQLTLNQTCHHLGVSTASVSSDLIKTTPEDLSSVIENYSELIKSLKFLGHLDPLDFREYGL